MPRWSSVPMRWSCWQAKGTRRTQREIKAKNGIDISVNGIHLADYEAAYDKYIDVEDEKRDVQAARDFIGAKYEDEPSYLPGETYKDYYGRICAKHYRSK